MKISQCAVLVTGGALRIGRAIVEWFAARGARVIIHYGRSADEAEALAASICGAGGQAATVDGDLADAEACTEIVTRAVAAAPGLDVLVNSAAIFHKAPLEAMTPGSLAREFQVNCFAPMLLTQAFARALAGRPGCVVNLLDRRVAGVEAGCIPYLVSKQALAAFTRNAALELAPGVRVNGVAPGPILSPPGEGDEVVRELAGRTPLTYRCTPADIATAVGFLVEQDGITGQTVFVDSGQHLNPEHRRT